MDTIKIGMYIASLRKAKNQTQSELAETLGVSDKTISKWESGKGLPDIAIIPDLVKALGVSVDELLAAESRKTSANESVFQKIAAGELNMFEEMGKGLKIDEPDGYGHTLAEACAEKNNIELFRLLIKLKKVSIRHKSETHTDVWEQTKTTVYEEKLIFDHARATGKFHSEYPKNYSDSEFFCFAVKNRADDILAQLDIECRAFTDEEAACIADDFDYFYHTYFGKAFPSYIGSLIAALLKQGKRKEAQSLLDLIPPYKQEMEQKGAEHGKAHSRNNFGTADRWDILWDTGAAYETVYDTELRCDLMMRHKIKVRCYDDPRKQPRIIGNAIVFTREDYEKIGFAAPDFLAACRAAGYAPNVDEKLLTLLLEKDDEKVFLAFTEGKPLSAALEKCILNSHGKIRAAYLKTNTPKNINDVIASGDIDLAMSVLSTPKATLQYANEVSLELLGTKVALPVLKKLLPFLEKAQLDKLLNELVAADNTEAKILLIESGAILRVLREGQWHKDELQTEILYRTLKLEKKERK